MKLTNRQLAVKFWEFIAQRGDKQGAYRQIAAYLTAERRTKDLAAITRALTDIRARRGVSEIAAVSRWPLTPEIKRAVGELFGAKKAIFNERLDKSVLGGARFETLDKRLDISLATKLQNLKAAK